MTLLFYGAQSMAMSYRSVHSGMLKAKRRLVWKRGDMLWLRGRCCSCSHWLLISIHERQALAANVFLPAASPSSCAP